jgi:UDP-2,3-diacylglucosamine pyrophosphatase LpxH
VKELLPATAAGVRSLPAFLMIGLVLLLVLGPLASCDSNETILGPLNSGGGDRTQIVVISDTHLGADLSYSETSENLQPLVDLLVQVRESPTVKELVIAGDFLDEWFVPATTETYAGGSQADFVGRIATTNRDVIGAVARIIREGDIRVTYVPGNHDLDITAENIARILPGMHQARDDVQGLGTYSPEGHPEIAIEHGHRYNFFCAPDPFSNSSVAPGSSLPPGYFLTRIAALHVVQHCTTPGDSIRTVTPNSGGGAGQALAYVYWKVWKALMLNLPVENRFDDRIIVTGLGGFAQTYAINDIMPYQATTGGFIDMNLFKGSVDTWDQRQVANHVAVQIPVLQALADILSPPGTDVQATTQYFANPASDVRIVVLGHTHDAKLITTVNHAGLKSIYANSGAWIDHSPGRTTMNFVVITPQGPEARCGTEVKVYGFTGEVMTELAADSLRI